MELGEGAVRNSSRPGERVFDPFGSSGATLIAAETSGQVARLMELDPRCVDDCAPLAGLDRHDCDSGLR